MDNCKVPVMADTGLGEMVSDGKLSDNLEYIWPDDGSPDAGKSQIVGYAKIQKIDWVIGVNKAQEIFSQPLTNLFRQNSLLVVVVGIIVIVLALRLARGIARPIGRLATAAQDVEDDKPFEPEDIEEVVELGDEVGNLARVFSHMVVSLRARMAELQTIYEIGNQISSSVELTVTLNYVIRALASVIEYDGAEISLYEEEKSRLVMNVAFMEKAGDTTLMMQRIYETEADFFPALFEKNGALLIEDISSMELGENSTRRSWSKIEPKSYLGMALRSKDKIVGTIEMVSSEVAGFSQQNLRILESVALQAATAIQNAREVQIRERRLKQQIQELRIAIDETKRSQEVEKIVSSDYFQSLRERARNLRERAARSETEDDAPAAEQPSE